MQTVIEPPSEAHHHEVHRRPGAFDLLAAVLLVVTIVLHVVAMFVTYLVGESSLAGQSDQAAFYGIIAGGWALALVAGFLGPHRTPIAAGLAVGVALGEIGFRVSDLSYPVNYGANVVGAGFWLMDAAWVVGAVAAALAVVAAHRRHRRPRSPGPRPDPGPVPATTDTETLAAVNPYDATVSDLPAPGASGAEGGGDDTDVFPAFSTSGVTPGTPPESTGGADARRERRAWTLLVVILAALAAGSFLPAWDHQEAVSALTGRRVISHNLGNAFSGPWLLVLGTVIAGALFLVVPVVAIRLRNKAVAAAAVVGVLVGLSAELASAVVQVSQAPQAAQFGLTPSQVNQYGLVLSLRLTGWFTVDALAAYALFAAFMVWSNLRSAEEPEPRRWTPDSPPPSAYGVPPAPPAAPRDPVGWP